MPPREGFCCATNRMRSVLPHRRMFPRRRALPNQACSRCLIDPPAEPQLLFRFVKSMLTDVGPVELWATRWRRPSAAANPQGFCGPATPRLTHFVTRVMLIRLDHIPVEENRPEQIR